MLTGERHERHLGMHFVYPAAPHSHICGLIDFRLKSETLLGETSTEPVARDPIGVCPIVLPKYIGVYCRKDTGPARPNHSTCLAISKALRGRWPWETYWDIHPNYIRVR